MIVLFEIFGIFMIFSWAFYGLNILYVKSGLERKVWLRGVEPSTIYLYIDIDAQYFKDTIDEWCKMHHRYIEDGKIIDMKL